MGHKATLQKDSILTNCKQAVTEQAREENSPDKVLEVNLEGNSKAGTFTRRWLQCRSEKHVHLRAYKSRAHQ